MLIVLKLPVRATAMDDYVGFAIAEALAEEFVILAWFSAGWFLFYGLLGPWLKVRVVHLRTGKSLPSAHRFGPVFVSHLFFSAVFVNPFTMFAILVKFDDVLPENVWFIFVLAAYFLMLSLLLECLLLRVVGRWRRLRWFQWRPPLRRAVPVSLVLSTLGFGAGAAGVYAKAVMPTIVRSFPLRPRAFDWKVDTGVKPLSDASLAAEPDRMMVDDMHIYVLVDAKRHQWRVVDRASHEVLANKAQALGYVLADDSGGSWQIRRSPGGLLYDRVSGGNPRAISIVVDRDVVLLEHQVNGLIVGASPSRGHLFAFDPEKQKIEWQLIAPAAKANNDRRIGSLAAGNGVIAVGLWTSRVWAVDATTGEPLWEFDEQGMGNDMYVVASGQIAMGFSASDKAYAFDLRSGQLKWSEDVGGLAGGIGPGNACLFGNRVVFRDNANVTCADALTGKVLWRGSVGNHYSGGVTCAGERIAACASDRTLALFDLDTGQEIFRTKFPVRSGIEYGFYGSITKAPGRIYAHPVIAGDGQVYVFTSDGVLWALTLH